jgi:cephalosporin hydroxylase
VSNSIQIDIQGGTLTQADGGRALPLGSPQAFSILSKVWLRAGWEAKYSYGFTWMGRPVIQLPEDLIRLQEVVYSLKPDIIIETGVAHGGSLVFHASLCRVIGAGRVVGVDVEIRPHNRQAIESHELFHLITLIEGDSTAPSTVRKVAELCGGAGCVLVVLDSCHSKSHVLEELKAYSPLVTKGSYIIATDGIMRDVTGVEGAKQDWTWDNPAEAATEFVASHPGFVIEEPPFVFNEGRITERVTYWPSGYIRRIG